MGAQSVRPAVRERALAQLQGPEFPESLRYLRDVLDSVHGRSGVGSMSVAPLTIHTLLDYQAASGASLSWLEMRALMYLDAVRLSIAYEASVAKREPRAAQPQPQPRR